MWASVRHNVGQFIGSTRANVMIVFALALPIAFGLLGMTIDYGTWLQQRTNLQGAADAAALAGAIVYLDTQDESAAETAAANAIAAHGFADASPTYGLAGGGYQVTLHLQGTKYFSGIVPTDPPMLGVVAVAAVPTDGGPCVLALDPNASNSLWLDSNAEIKAPKCKVHANSKSSSGIDANSNSHIMAQKICVSGGYGGGDGHYSPTPQQGCATIADPLAGVAAPAHGGCNHTDLELDDAHTTLSPGVYCGGILIKNNSVVGFNPGTYIIKDGKFHVDGNSIISGAGVSFYLTGNDATLFFDSNVAIDFTAPSSGPQAGVIFFEDRNAPELREHRLDSNNISRLEGAIYLSKGSLRIDSNSQIAANSAFTIIVVNRLRLDSNAELVLNADYDSTSVPALSGGAASGDVRLIE